MSPRRGPASPIKKIRLKTSLEGEESSLARVSEVLKGPTPSGNELVVLSEASDPTQAIQELVRVRDAVRQSERL